MGITTHFREFLSAFVRVPAVSLVCLSCVVCTAHAERPQGVATDLAIVIDEIDKALTKHVEASVLYQVHGRLLSTDLGYPIFDWSSTERAVRNPFSKTLRSLIFHAVCRQNKIALKKLFEVNKLIYGGVFNELQSYYVQNVADSLSLKLNFVDQRREIDDIPSTNLRWINHKRRLMAALNNDRPDEALRLLSTFAMLCNKPN